MATSTTKLGLTKPDFVDVVDVSELNTNADAIDAAVGATIVTSATRPASPWAGQIIYETDTESTFVWTGSAWIASGGGASVTVATTAPVGPDEGDLWLNSTEAKMYVYYDDGTSAQWVAAVGGTVPSQGKIIAVKDALFTGTQTASVAASGNVAVTDLSITHTLANSANKLIISAYLGSVGHSQNFGQTGLGVADDGTLIGIGDTAGSRTRVGAAGHVGSAQGFVRLSSALSFVYEPGDTASHTYTVRAINVRQTTETLYINRTATDTDEGNVNRSSSAFIIQEVSV
jgi:hypothetical protein